MSQLKDILRIANGDISNIDTYGSNGHLYVNEYSIANFMNENNIESIDTVLEQLEMKHNSPIVTEAIDMDIVNSALKSKPKDIDFDKLKDMLSAYILGRNYDSIGEYDMQIRRCDRAIHELEDERKKAKDMKNNDSYKFSVKFYVSLIKILISIPDAVESLANGIDRLRVLKIYNSAVYIVYAVRAIPILCKNLVLSFKDYDKLLSIYQNAIVRIRAELVKKREEAIERKEKEGKKNG